MGDRLLTIERLIRERNEPINDMETLRTRLEENKVTISNLNETVISLKLENNLLMGEKGLLVDENANLRLKLKESESCVEAQAKSLAEFDDKLDKAGKLICEQKDNMEALTIRISKQSEMFANDLKKSLQEEFRNEKEDIQRKNREMKDEIKHEIVKVEVNISHMHEKFTSFEENAKVAVSTFSKQTRDMCLGALEQKKSQIDTNFANKLEEVRTDLQADLSDNIEFMHEDIEKINATVKNVENSQNQVSSMKLCKDLGKWYHLLKNASENAVDGHGLLIQKAIEECIDETKFAILLDILQVGALQWKNPKNNNMNALQLSWTVEGAEKLTSMISSRIGDEIIHLSEDEVLGEWYEKVEVCSNDLYDQLQFYIEALTSNMSSYPQFMNILCSRLRCEIQELVYNVDKNILQKWLPKLVLAVKNGDKRVQSALLFEFKNENVDGQLILFKFMCHVLGADAVKHMYDHVCFDISNNNVKSITNNSMTIKGTHMDNQKHGALLNVGINDGIAKWEVNVDSRSIDAEMGIGILEKSDTPNIDWSYENPKAITIDGYDGNKYIRGKESAYCEQWETGSNINQLLTICLDMIKGEFSMKIDGIDKGIIADGLTGTTWYPYFFMEDYDYEDQPCSFTLKSFKFL